MRKIFKEWKNMTPEQKSTEKMAMLAMGAVMAVIIALFLIACCAGCNNPKTNEDIYTPRDTTTNSVDTVDSKCIKY